jgi:hypothetical protein
MSAEPTIDTKATAVAGHQSSSWFASNANPDPL